MTVFVLGSLHGAPGVTTTALLVTGCLTDGVLVEADLDGGVLAVRHGLGREPGLTTMAAAQSSDGSAWREHAQDAGGVPVLVEPESPEHVATLWARAGDSLMRHFATTDDDVVVDAGRLRPGVRSTATLLDVADVVAVLVRPEADHLVLLSHRLADLRQHGVAVGAVLCGAGSYGADDVATQLEVDVLGVIPEVRNAARAFQGGMSAGLQRTELARAVRSLGDALVAATTSPGPAAVAADADPAPTETAVREEEEVGS